MRACERGGQKNQSQGQTGEFYFICRCRCWDYRLYRRKRVRWRSYIVGKSVPLMSESKAVSLSPSMSVCTTSLHANDQSPNLCTEQRKGNIQVFSLYSFKVKIDCMIYESTLYIYLRSSGAILLTPESPRWRGRRTLRRMVSYLQEQLYTNFRGGGEGHCCCCNNSCCMMELTAVDHQPHHHIKAFELSISLLPVIQHTKKMPVACNPRAIN